jgi:hypothetical protein
MTWFSWWNGSRISLEKLIFLWMAEWRGPIRGLLMWILCMLRELLLVGCSYLVIIDKWVIYVNSEIINSRRNSVRGIYSLLEYTHMWTSFRTDTIHVELIFYIHIICFIFSYHTLVLIILLAQILCAMYYEGSTFILIKRLRMVIVVVNGVQIFYSTHMLLWRSKCV